MSTSDDSLQLTQLASETLKVIRLEYTMGSELPMPWTWVSQSLHRSILKTNVAITYWLFYYVKGTSQIFKGDYPNFYKKIWVLLLLLFLQMYREKQIISNLPGDTHVIHSSALISTCEHWDPHPSFSHSPVGWLWSFYESFRVRHWGWCSAW